MNDKSAIQIDNLDVHYGKTFALEDISIDIKEGEYLGIIGPNGGGKSTLIKAILGLIDSTKDKIKIFGKPVKESQERIGYVPQFSPVDKKFPISVMEVVLTGKMKEGIRPFFSYSKKDKEETMELLKEVGIENLAKRQISELSGGEFQKMLIARALSVNPRILLLDEPTASVDDTSRRQIYSFLSMLNAERNMTIVLVTHDIMAVSSQVHRLACLNGRLFYHGEPELSKDLVNHLYGCPVDLIAHGVPHRVLKEHEGE